MMDNVNQQLLDQIKSLQRDLRQSSQELSTRFTTLESALRINGHLNAVDDHFECRGNCLLKMIWVVTCAALFGVIYHFITR